MTPTRAPRLVALLAALMAVALIVSTYHDLGQLSVPLLPHGSFVDASGCRAAASPAP